MLSELFRSAFKLVYSHEGHITRVVFFFLNVWFLMIESFPSRFGVLSILSGTSSWQSIIVCLGVVLIGILLILFREHDGVINAHYYATEIMTITGLMTSIYHPTLRQNIALFLALFIICLSSHIRYRIKRQGGFNAMKNKAALDLEQTIRLIDK